MAVTLPDKLYTLKFFLKFLSLKKNGSKILLFWVVDNHERLNFLLRDNSLLTFGIEC